jgi:hypothetical protein
MTAAQLDRRLLAYSLTAGAAVAGSTAGAAIVYTELDPAVVIDGAPLAELVLDLNNDNIDDFRLERDTFSNYYAPPVGNRSTFVNAVNFNTNGSEATYASPYLANRILASTSSGAFGAALAANVPVSGQNSGWTSGWPHLARARQGRIRNSWMTGSTTSSPGYMTSSTYATGPYRYGPWHGQGERYLGLAFYIEGELHYGWVRCSVAEDLSSLTVLDYAYQSVPGVGILAGDIGETATPGRAMAANAVGVVPGDQFTSKPKITGLYYVPNFAPVGDARGDGVTPKKATAKVLDKPDAENPVGMVRYDWTKKIRLYDAKAFKAAYKEGITADAQGLVQHPLPIELQLTSKQLDDPKTPVAIPEIQLMAPTVEVVLDGEGNPTNVALPGAQLVIRGGLFGQKAPKAWMEYRANGEGPVKMLKLKLVKAYEDAKGVAQKSIYKYPNAAGKLASSVMDTASGISEITVVIPEKLPKGWLHQEVVTDPEMRGRPASYLHSIVIDNGVGLAIVPFDTEEARIPD